MARRKDKSFEVLPAGEMRRRYSLVAENRRTITLNPNAVPQELRHLIPLAERFGESDDLIRADIMAKAPREELAAVRHAVAAQDEDFDAWLAGPEADGPHLSPEYIAFTCLRMACDGV
jgi:hypothetical protein